MLSNFKTLLKEKLKLNENTYQFRFSLLDPKEIFFKPGQYLILKIQNKNRLYSIASPSYEKKYFDLIVKIIPNGLASDYFINLKISDQVDFSGPAGLFRLKNNQNKKIFLAVSTGIAPFMSMIRSKNYNFESKYFLFWGLRYKNDIYFLEELNRIKEKSNNKFDFRICLSQEKEKLENQSQLMYGRINVGLDIILKNKNLRDYEYYICGGNQFVDDIKIFLEKNVPRERIIFEKYGF